MAIVEINNENALTQEWWGGRLDEMPPAYVDELQKQLESFLVEKYGDFETIKRAWGVLDEPAAAEMLSNASFARGLDGWDLERHGAAEGDAQAPYAPRKTRPVLAIDVAALDGGGWHVQLDQARLASQGIALHHRVSAPADAPRRIWVNAMQAHEPWKQLWTADTPLSTEWRTLIRLPACSDEDDARVTLPARRAEPGDSSSPPSRSGRAA